VRPAFVMLLKFQPLEVADLPTYMIPHLEDGAGPYTCQADATGTGAAFVDMTVTQQVPGKDVPIIGSLSGAKATNFTLAAQMPAGTTCTGAGGACLVRCMNSAIGASRTFLKTDKIVARCWPSCSGRLLNPSALSSPSPSLTCTLVQPAPSGRALRSPRLARPPPRPTRRACAHATAKPRRSQLPRGGTTTNSTSSRT